MRAAGDNVGSYAVSQRTLVANGNYSLDVFAGDPFNIDPALTFAASGFRFTDTAASVLTGGLVRAPGEDVGAFTITQGSLAANANYAVAFSGNSFAIDPALLTVTASTLRRNYGDAKPPLVVAITGFKLAETAGVLERARQLTIPATTASPVGDYATVAAGDPAANSTFVDVAGVLGITPASLAIVTDSLTRTYGEPDCAMTFAANANYALTFAGSTFTISPAGLVGTVNDAVQPAARPNPDFTVRHAGFRRSDAAAALGGTLVFATAADLDSLPGRFPVTASGLTATHYTLTYQPGTLVVIPRMEAGLLAQLLAGARCERGRLGDDGLGRTDAAGIAGARGAIAEDVCNAGSAPPSRSIEFGCVDQGALANERARP